MAADTTYRPLTYRRAGGDESVIASGGKLIVESGGTIEIESGGLVTGLTVTASVVAPDASDGAALGSGTLMWSDLFLASGGIIDFNNGDVTITHSANLLTIGSGGLSVSGSVTLGTSGTDTVTFNAKLGSQLYANLTGTDYTILKIHNHATTAEIGGLETKGELINTTGSVVGEQASWTYEPTGTTGAPSGVSASSNVLAISSGFTVTAGNIYALVGEAQLYGTLNGATVNVAGVIGVVGGNGANTQVLHMAGIQSAMSTGLVNPTTGTLSHFLANSLSTVIIDNLLCMQDSEYITNFASFNAAATDKCVEASVAEPAGNTTHALRILVEGVPGYIPVYAAKTF